MWQVFIIWLPDTYWRPLVCVYLTWVYDLHTQLVHSLFLCWQQSMGHRAQHTVGYQLEDIIPDEKICFQLC